jgi:hypothetical protein
VELEGAVSGLGGSCPNVTFKIRGTTVIADNSTRYDDGSCSSLRNGRKVEVTGRELPDGTVRAEEIEIDD